MKQAKGPEKKDIARGYSVEETNFAQQQMLTDSEKEEAGAELSPRFEAVQRRAFPKPTKS